MYPYCLYGVFQVYGEEGSRTCKAVIYPNRVVLECDGHDVSDRVKDRELFLAEEVDRAIRSRSTRLTRRGEPDLRLGLLVNAFMILEGDLHYNQVTLPRCGILYNPKSDILVTKCLVMSISAKRFPDIVIVIGVVDIIPRLGLVVIGVFEVIY
jgi:hypothetical protein